MSFDLALVASYTPQIARGLLVTLGIWLVNRPKA